MEKEGRKGDEEGEEGRRKEEGRKKEGSGDQGKD